MDPSPALIDVAPHQLLDVGLVEARFPGPLGDVPSPEWLLALLREDAPAPLERGEDVRAAVRDLLRHAGYKPTGRGKPASEYLVRAVAEDRLPSVNPAVDVCNVVSYHSGLPISVVDLEATSPPLRVDVAAPGERYVFNASGQEMDVGKLLCLFDAAGPCGNGVKDSQRTKTGAATTRTLSVLWGTNALAGRTGAAVRWYGELLERLGAEVLRP